MKTGWQDMAPTLPPVRNKAIPQTRDYWRQMAAMDQELILEQRAQISKLEMKVNDLRQKLKRGNLVP